MKKEMEIEWIPLEIKVSATLLEDKNPKLCDLLWKNLPYNSIQCHALISGQHIYHYNPIVESFFVEPEVKESRAKSLDGTVFLSYLQHLSIKYGDVTEDLPAAPVARVPLKDISKLKEAGRKCWESTYKTKEPIEVRVTKKGTAPTKKDFLLKKKFKETNNGELNKLLYEILEETQKIWTKPPQEIVDLHSGKIRSGAGSYNQYFSTMVFANGEIRHLGYNALGGLVKTSQNPKIKLKQLKEMTKNFTFTPAEFLGYCGLNKIWNFVDRTLNIVDTIKTKKEYYNLVSTLATYVNRINGWSLHYFPWKHGEEYKQKGARK